MTHKDLLFEIGCEELPASMQVSLAFSLAENIKQGLYDENLAYREVQTYSSPRRLAVIVKDLDEAQAPQTNHRIGPAIASAYDKEGTPTMACLGFARSCGVSVDQLEVQATARGERVCVVVDQPGQATQALLADIILQAVKKLSLSKPMRWGSHDEAFVRPVHWVLLLFGKDIIPMTLFGQQASDQSYGHRFHHPKPLRITSPQDYEVILYSQGNVIVDALKRKKKILQAMKKCLPPSTELVLDEDLLNEVAALVEWPVVLRGTFNADFLAMPKEVLITSMQSHQKCFAVINTQTQQLEPVFILVSNIESRNSELVVKGNERVIRARLSDAQFFYDNDLLLPLPDLIKPLDKVIFQRRLGTLGDKSKRLVKSVRALTQRVQVDNPKEVERAALLAKCDLLTEMVGEFPSLQGVMGGYYALAHQEAAGCAQAIAEHYHPRYSGDTLPESLAGCLLALVDKLDTIVGIIGINKLPKADKDPFALRRASIGIIRILIERQLPFDLLDMIKCVKKSYTVDLDEGVVDKVLQYIMQRMKSYYLEQQIAVEVFTAVLASGVTQLADFDCRVKAVLEFVKLPEAQVLAAANKRVSNILKKQASHPRSPKINDQLIELEAERSIVDWLEQHHQELDLLYEQGEYASLLTVISTLKSPIDAFFDQVMIMSEDAKLRNNRLAILFHLQKMFTKVADISLLPQT